MDDMLPGVLQDVIRKRRTGIDSLNGYVFAGLVNSFPVGTLRPDLKSIDPLVRMLPR